MTSASWAAASAVLQAEIGGTWGGFVQLLDQDAALVSTDVGDPSHVPDVLDVAVAKAFAAVGTSLSGTLLAQTEYSCLRCAGLCREQRHADAV